MTIESVLKELLGKHFSKVSEFCLDFIKRNHNEDGIRITFDYLLKLDLKTEKIAKNAQLLGRNPKTIQDRFDRLRSLGISPQKIAQNARLLTRNPETIQDHYKNLKRLGISPQKIASNTQLLGSAPKTIQNHYDQLISLGISPQKITSNVSLLWMNPETIQDHYDVLISLGIPPLKIVSNVPLLGSAPKTIQDHYRYLIKIIKLEENRIQNTPQLLLFNPDVFAKKLRILKLDILGLRRKSAFNPNEYPQFYLSSPATLLAKKNYCAHHKIDVLNSISPLRRPWRKLMKRVDKALGDVEADKEGRRITHSYKQRYDNWMREYKRRCRDFYLRRGRRLIIKV